MAVSTTELNDAIGIQIVSYRQKCDMAWSEKVDGAITQEEYEKSIEWGLNYATKAINKLISEEVVKELGKVGFDKRLDNPLLYCEGNDSIPLEERIRELRGNV